MDIQLAGPMDGIAAADAIRTQFSLPVVFLTAFAEDDTLARARLTEPFGYILKPFSERELRTVIEMALYKHKAESRLRESEARYRAVIESASEAIVSVDSAGNIVGWNPGAERMFGYTEAEVTRSAGDAAAAGRATTTGTWLAWREPEPAASPAPSAQRRNSRDGARMAVSFR